MLVATPGQTTAYSTLHNSGNTTTGKKSTLTSNTTTNASASSVGTPKSLINNNHNSSTASNINNSYSSQHHQIHKNDNNKNNNTATTTTSKDLNSTKTATHSLKVENSHKPINFIQTLKDSVQKALISTTSICSLANKHNSDNKLQNCNNTINTTTTSSLANVTSSSNNIAKAAAITAAAIATTASTSSFSLVRNKYSSCSLSKLHTIAPTNLHRYPEDRQQASSTDSLQKEMCHFKPIRTAPTTPWKSGSKSRGNSLRFPKANFATKKTEFILKSNCDVNNRKKKYQQQQQQQLQDDHTDEDVDNQDEQENKEYYGIYKPKPSSMFLSSSVTTPNHQSAFVCLVAQMKNLVNIQSKKRITTSGKVVGRSASSVVGAVGNLELPRTKSTRMVRLAKDAVVVATANATHNTNAINKKAKSNPPVKELFVRQNQRTTTTTNKSLLPAKKVILPKELVKSTRSTRRLTMTAAAKMKQQHTKTPDLEGNVIKSKPPNKTADISKIYPALGITKAKSRRKLGSNKSKIINIVQLATSIAKDKLLATVNRRATFTGDAVEAKGKQPVNKRKRKISQEDLSADASPPTTNTSLKPTRKARKSARLSRDVTNNTTAASTTKKAQITTYSSSTNDHSKQKQQQQRSTVCVSPPLTRARLKYLNQELGKVTNTTTTTVTKVEVKKRKQ